MEKKIHLLNQDNIANSNIMYFRYSLDTFLNIQKDLNIRSIDFWGGTPHIWIDHMGYEDCKLIKDKFLKSNISIVSFTPNPYNYSLASTLNTIRRKKSIDYYINCIKVAYELGSPYIYIVPFGGEFDNSKGLLLEMYIESLIELLPIAKEYKIKILMSSLPNGDSKILNTMEEVQEIYRRINDENLKILLNTHYISMAGEKIEDWLRTFGEDIVHTHFIDGRYSGQRVWGEGCYPLARYLQSMVDNNYKGLLGQIITSDRYHENTERFDKKNIMALRKYLMEGERDGFH